MDVEGTIAALDRGEVRVAEKVDGEWRVNEDAKQAILEYFRLRKVEPIEVVQLALLLGSGIETLQAVSGDLVEHDTARHEVIERAHHPVDQTSNYLARVNGASYRWHQIEAAHHSVARQSKTEIVVVLLEAEPGLGRVEQTGDAESAIDPKAGKLSTRPLEP